ncbi:MAG: hypothetical protein RIQ41_474 [Candidatus Parcubacteria bacterium]
MGQFHAVISQELLIFFCVAERAEFPHSVIEPASWCDLFLDAHFLRKGVPRHPCDLDGVGAGKRRMAVDVQGETPHAAVGLENEVFPVLFQEIFQLLKC